MGRRALPAGLAGLAVLLLAGLVALSVRLFTGPGPAGLAIGGPFTLVDGDGRTVTERDFAGKWMLVYFGYTHCPDACPTALNEMAVALDKLGAKKAAVRPVFVTVDPERDTPAVMKDYVSAFDAGIIGLTGTPDQVAQVERAYRVYAAKHPTEGGGYDMDHSSIIYIMDPAGRFVATFTSDNSPDEIAQRLGQLVS